MIDLHELLWGFSIVSLVLFSIQRLRSLMMSVAVGHDPLAFSPSPRPLSTLAKVLTGRRGLSPVSPSFLPETVESLPSAKGEISILGNRSADREGQTSGTKLDDSHDESCPAKYDNLFADERCREVREKGLHDERPHEINSEAMSDVPASSAKKVIASEKASANMLRKRPARLILPENFPVLEFGCERLKKRENKEFEVEGRDYCLVSKRGKRDVMEDSYGVMVDVAGDPKQAFFAVIDGHGGRTAADYVAENLGNNILREAETVGKERGSPEEAIREGYLVTDKEFLSQGVASGACAASVLLKDGRFHVANVGDCRVVLCRNGVANALTRDHRVSREDERLRIENSGGFVHSRNGVWRVHGSLTISRAIGDLHLKEWVISEPEIKTCRITPDCKFLIMASDGLWDKVSDQGAVDLVSKQGNLQESCKKLVELACSKGSMDDITVMLINLQNFCS
ncbi:probable protein phosphatase 2C 2 [Rhodamnia argentea]|uniref:Probable protein phosphatase 2C 2 n=1 Tax=Rhodamnia argentea TaxID=178133 RepID=A0A8B8NKM5_9MYRT|nr:probable protein phosphatase 2C 2 [Rhodamnia argentea]